VDRNLEMSLRLHVINIFVTCILPRTNRGGVCALWNLLLSRRDKLPTTNSKYIGQFCAYVTDCENNLVLSVLQEQLI